MIEGSHKHLRQPKRSVFVEVDVDVGHPSTLIVVLLTHEFPELSASSTPHWPASQPYQIDNRARDPKLVPEPFSDASHLTPRAPDRPQFSTSASMRREVRISKVISTEFRCCAGRRNDNCVALIDRAETAETSFSSFVRSEPKSFDIEFKGCPENLTFSLLLRVSSVTIHITRLLKLQPKTQFTGQGYVTSRQVLSRIGRICQNPSGFQSRITTVGRRLPTRNEKLACSQ